MSVEVCVCVCEASDYPLYVQATVCILCVVWGWGWGTIIGSVHTAYNIKGVSTAKGGRGHVNSASVNALIEIQVKTRYAINRCRVTRQLNPSEVRKIWGYAHTSGAIKLAILSQGKSHLRLA